MVKKLCNCGNKESKYFIKNNSGPSIVECKKCGLLRTSPFSESTISEPIDFENRLNNLDLWQSFAYKIVLLIKKYKKKKNLRVLDIGCNIGIFVDLSEKEGWKATGIDIDKRAVDIGKKQFNCDLKETSLEKANFKKEEFDVIVLVHTLEHIYDLSKLLKEIKEIIKKDGILIIQVPNINGLPVIIQKLRGKPWYGYDFAHHLWHFQPKTLKNLLSKNNFQLVDINSRSSMFYESTGMVSDFIRKLTIIASWLINRGDQLTLVAQPKK